MGGADAVHDLVDALLGRIERAQDADGVLRKARRRADAPGLGDALGKRPSPPASSR